MGQHKYNPIAKLAKEGVLPKLPMKLSKRERIDAIYRDIAKANRRDYSLMSIFQDGIKI